MLDKNRIHDTADLARSPYPMLAAGALIPSSLISSVALILWVSTRNVVGTFWVCTSLAGFMVAMSAVQMIARKWDLYRVALFVTTSGAAMGIGYAGALLFGGMTWPLMPFGLLFVTMLVALFTGLEDKVKLHGIIVAMAVPAAIVGFMFRYILQLAG